MTFFCLFSISNAINATTHKDLTPFKTNLLAEPLKAVFASLREQKFFQILGIIRMPKTNSKQYLSSSITRLISGLNSKEKLLLRHSLLLVNQSFNSTKQCGKSRLQTISVLLLLCFFMCILGLDFIQVLVWSCAIIIA